MARSLLGNQHQRRSFEFLAVEQPWCPARPRLHDQALGRYRCPPLSVAPGAKPSFDNFPVSPNLTAEQGPKPLLSIFPDDCFRQPARPIRIDPLGLCAGGLARMQCHGTEPGGHEEREVSGRQQRFPSFDRGSACGIHLHSAGVSGTGRVRWDPIGRPLVVAVRNRKWPGPSHGQRSARRSARSGTAGGSVLLNAAPVVVE